MSSDPTWAPGPRRPRLGEGEIHVWLADLERCDGEVLASLLSSDERTRAQRVLGDTQRALWCSARGLLRELLGRYLERDPRTLSFTHEHQGKPVLASEAPLAAERPEFNLSHSGSLALYAFSSAGVVGVDLELADRPLDEVRVAARMLGAEAASRLEKLEPATREQEFLRAWTRHEARLKWSGAGIGGGPSTASGREPWIAQLEIGPRIAAALAADRQPRELCRWDWREPD